MNMYNPPRPREVIRELCLKPLNISRKTLSSIINGHAGISQEMAIRLSIAFGTTAERSFYKSIY